MKKWTPWKKLGILAQTTFIIAILSCGTNTDPTFHPNPNPNPNPPPFSTELCNCTPSEPDSSDFRHAAKHVPLPDGTPQEITVATILSWPQAAPAFDAPRSGRELQLFHISLAYLQAAMVVGGDCDVHMELSGVPDKSAPRVIVETPVDSGYCSARGQIQAQLSQHGFTLTQTKGGELQQALPVSVLGLAFQDFPHQRGSQFVATAWELHPAIVTINP